MRKITVRCRRSASDILGVFLVHHDKHAECLCHGSAAKRSLDQRLERERHANTRQEPLEACAV